MTLRGMLWFSSFGMLLFGQVVDSASAYAWVMNVGGLGMAAILALKTIPDDRREFRKALDRNTDAMTELRLHLAGAKCPIGASPASDTSAR